MDRVAGVVIFDSENGWKITHQVVDGTHRIMLWRKSEIEGTYIAFEATPKQMHPFPADLAKLYFHEPGKAKTR